MPLYNVLGCSQLVEDTLALFEALDEAGIEEIPAAEDGSIRKPAYSNLLLRPTTNTTDINELIETIIN